MQAAAAVNDRARATSTRFWTVTRSVLWDSSAILALLDADAPITRVRLL